MANELKRICAWCEKPFILTYRQSYRKKYCSHACSSQAKFFMQNGRVQYNQEDLRPKREHKIPFDRHYAERQKAQTIEMYARVQL